MKHQEQLYAYFGHHRCATTWITRVVSAVCDNLGLNCVVVDSEAAFTRDLRSFVADNRVDFLCYINADIEYVRQLDRFVGFHVVRDPRDVVVSSYFSHMYSHPTDNWPRLIDHRKKLRTVSLEEGLNLEMVFRSWSFAHMLAWDYCQDSVFEHRMELLTERPYAEFARIFRFLGLLKEAESSGRGSHSELIGAFVNKLHRKSRGLVPINFPVKHISPTILANILNQNSFSSLAEGRKRGEENLTSHYRKGIAGDWANYFTREHIEVFDRLYGELLAKLGYVNTP